MAILPASGVASSRLDVEIGLLVEAMRLDDLEFPGERAGLLHREADAIGGRGVRSKQRHCGDKRDRKNSYARIRNDTRIQCASCRHCHRPIGLRPPRPRPRQALTQPPAGHDHLPDHEGMRRADEVVGAWRLKVTVRSRLRPAARCPSRRRRCTRHCAADAVVGEGHLGAGRDRDARGAEGVVVDLDRVRLHHRTRALDRPGEAEPLRRRRCGAANGRGDVLAAALEREHPDHVAIRRRGLDRHAARPRWRHIACRRSRR